MSTFSVGTPNRPDESGPRAPDGLMPNAVGLFRNLAEPIAVQGPVVGVAIVPATMAAIVGRAGPLSFLMGVVAGLFLVTVFMKLAARIVSAGSLYHFSAALLGVRWAFIVGYMYFLVFFLFVANILPLGAAYFDYVVSSMAGHPELTGAWWVVPAILLWCGMLYIASRQISISTAVLLTIEVVSVLLVTVAGIVVLVKGGYGGHNFSFTYFTPGRTPIGSVALGIATAFLGFGGFESGAFLGEETRSARRLIPRGMLMALLFSGLFFTFGSWFQMVGAKSAAALAASPAPLFDTIATYTVPGLGIAVAALATVSAFSGLCGNANGLFRLGYTLGRDIWPTSRLVRTDPTTKAPTGSIAVLALPALVVCIAFFWTTPTTAFDYLGTGAGLFLTIVYFVVAAAAIRYFLQHREWTGAICAVAGTVIVGYALYSTLVPAAPYPYNLIDYLSFGLVAVGIIILTVSGRLQKALAASPYLRRVAAGESSLVEESVSGER